MLKRLVRFTLPILVFALSAPMFGVAAAAVGSASTLTSASGSGATSALTQVPTRKQLDIVASTIDVSAAAGLISPTGIAKSFKAKVAEIRKAVDAGDDSRAIRQTDGFLKDLDAKRGRGVTAETVDVISDLLIGGLPPTVLSVPVGVASVVVTDVGSVPVVITLPAGTPVAWVRISAAPAASIARPSGTTRIGSIDIAAFDTFGQAVRQLGANARINIGFEASTAVNAASARISTIGLGGGPETLATQVSSGADAYTASASTTHFTPFALDAQTTTPPWRYTYIAPPKITAITPSTGNICGNTTIVVTGSGFSGGNLIPEVGGVTPQSFTVDSDTQITMLTSVGSVTPSGSAGSVAVSTFFTSTALPPEFANTRIDLDPSPPYRLGINASAGPNIAGTATYTPVAQPVVPRVTGLTPNQGPTIGAPVHPSQDFSNTPIRITGCGFTGATAVLFGAIPSVSFTVQDDTVIFATPPVPGVGTVEVRVVTPLGTSSLIP